MPNRAETVGIDHLLAPAGHTETLLGNEAIIRGALEAGVGFACGYPGTPSSEITDGFARIADAANIAFEYSINEKIAVEMAFAASLAGTRSLCAMKHLGLMAAGDPLSTMPYVGVEAGMVIVSAADPSCRTSPNEQDQRHLGPMLHIPVLEPSTVAEAHRLARFAFELSEKCRQPVLLRPTTRVCHVRAPVQFGALAERPTPAFKRNPPRYVPIPVNARRMRGEIAGRIERARELIEQEELLHCEGAGRAAVLASGPPALICRDLIRELGAGESIALWSLAAAHPLPERPLIERLRQVDRLLVIEELSPFLEDAVRNLCARNGISIEILGKRSGHLPEEFEIDTPQVRTALFRALALGDTPPPHTPLPQVPIRAPSLCPGCGHRATFFAARTALADSQLYFNDIGCYTLGYGPPLHTADALLCMGAGFTLAAGVSRVTGKRTVGFMGDGTFFHSGMPALLNAIKQRANIIAVILDNQVTAMTGFQESASDPEGHSISIERVVRSLGAPAVEVIDPYDLTGAIAAFRRAASAQGISVIIGQRMCPSHKARREGISGRLFEVDHARCVACGRDGNGHRCGQEPTAEFTHQLGRAALNRAPTRANEAPDTAPCNDACPLSLCVQGYVGHVAAQEYAEAFGHIMERVVLPASVCRVCHRPCETACVRNNSDGAVAINDLKRFVVDWAKGAEHPLRQPAAPANSLDQRIAVVGAGPAGLAAANDLRLRGYRVTLFDAAEQPGGLLARGIPAYRLPRDELQRDIDRLLNLGVEFVGNTRIGLDRTLAQLLDDGFAALFLAVGASRAKRIDIPGAHDTGAPEVVDALGFLARANSSKGVRVPARVVVIGGGNAAIDAARVARRSGADVVSLVCIEDRETMPAIDAEIAAAETEGIEIITAAKPVGLGPGVVTIAPVSAEDVEDRPLSVGLVILAVGQEPDLEFAQVEGAALRRDAQGCLMVDAITHQTSHPRIFAGGDAVGGNERTVTAAMASGLRAAWAIDRTLRGAELGDLRTPPSTVKRSGHPKPPYIPRFTNHRNTVPELPLPERMTTFREVVTGFSEAHVRSEAARCLACGLCGNCNVCIEQLGCPALLRAGRGVRIDPTLCNGCGVCAEVCPSNAIRTAVPEIRAVTETAGALLPPVSNGELITLARRSKPSLRILLAGVGGQGVLTASQIIGNAAQAADLPVVVGQLHGMSQRGGTVTCSVVIQGGDNAAIADGEADILIGFEPLEAYRSLPQLRADSRVLFNTGTIVPFELTRTGAPYPDIDDLTEELRDHCEALIPVDGPTLVKKAGAKRALNTVMLGALAGLGDLPFDTALLWQAIDERCPKEYREANRTAFELGQRWSEGWSANGTARNPGGEN